MSLNCRRDFRGPLTLARLLSQGAQQGADLLATGLQRLVADGHGDFVVLAGRNNTKLETMASLTKAGLHVLADKPWLTDSRQLPYLAQVTAGPRLAMDLMTGRHSPQARLIVQVIHTPEPFGTFLTSSPA